MGNFFERMELGLAVPTRPSYTRTDTATLEIPQSPVLFNQLFNGVKTFYHRKDPTDTQWISYENHFYRCSCSRETRNSSQKITERKVKVLEKEKAKN